MAPRRSYPARRRLSKGETVYEVDTTDLAEDPRVLGVFSSETTRSGEDRRILVNAVGDGFILVTDTGGDIEVGDFLTSSGRAGHAQRQRVSQMMNYTIAKSFRRVRWSEVKIDPNLGFRWRLVPCTFRAG